jgi:predicted phage terminase large subunit-like protein
LIAFDELFAHDLNPDRFIDALSEWPGELANEAVAIRCSEDVGTFCLAYFPERFTSSFNRLHLDFLSRRKIPWSRRRKKRRWADAAPRGFAKSTIVSFAHAVHDVIYGFEAYIGLISTTKDLSDKLTEDLYEVFTSPEAYSDLHRDFGPFKVKGSKTDFVCYVPGQDARGVRLKAFSFGTTIRGEKHAGIRPTKIIIDDGEHPGRVRTGGQRRKTWDFLTRDIQPAGDDHTIYWVVGTLLHAESMLARLLTTSGWDSRIWQAIQEWPTDGELWNECRDIYRDRYSDHREDAARAFYDEHKAAMDAGADVLWKDKRPIFYLMTEMWTLGRAAFASEYQNDPLDPSKLVFDPRTFRRCKFDGVRIYHLDKRGDRTHTIPLVDCKVAIFLDPAGGRRGGDWACFAIVAADKQGYRYVIEVRLERIPPNEQRDMMWELFEKYGPTAIYGNETNKWATLFIDEDFQRQKNARRVAGLPWRLDVGGYHIRGQKETRIRNIQPAAAEGMLMFADDLPSEMDRQFRDFPTAEYDDAPDAIERAVWLLEEGDTPTATGGVPW